MKIALRVLCVVVCASVIVRGQYIPASPCPDMFSYRNEGRQVYGAVRYQPTGESNTLKLIANFTIKAMLPSSYIGNIETIGGQQYVLKSFLRGEPLHYRINFPITSPLPKLQAIVFNNNIECLGQSEFAGPGEYLTTISLEHKLYADSYSSTFPIRRPNYDAGNNHRPNYDNDNNHRPNYDNDNNHRPNYDNDNNHRPNDNNDRVVYTKNGQTFIIKTNNLNIEDDMTAPSVTINTITKPNGAQNYKYQWYSPDQNLQPTSGTIFENLLQECVRAASSSARSQAQEQRGSSTYTTTTCRLGSSSTPYRQSPSISQGPSISQQGPFVPQQDPFQPQQGPSISQQRPFVPQQRPFVPQQRPSVPQQRPFVPQQRPSVPQQRPFVPQQRPFVPQQRPSVQQQEPPVAQSIPQETVPPIHTSSSVRMECGVVSGAQGGVPLVYYGSSVRRGEWPWLTALYKKQDYIYICAGSLISNKHVITAAHCMYDKTVIIGQSEFVMKVGAFNLDSWNEGVFRELRAFKIHESYEPHTQANDILLLTLDSPVEYTEYNRPICLWEGDSNAAFVAGHRGMVVSWGQSELRGGGKGEPRKANLPIVTNEVCRSSRIEFHKLTSENTICAGDRNGTGPCNGDSGSGLFMFWGGRWRLRGIVSVSLRPITGEVRCNLNEYVVFTDVAQYLPWITNNMIG